MPVLISLGINSAYDVMAYPEVEFISLYDRKYLEMYGKTPTQAESQLVYRKAKQVSSVTYNLFTIVKKLDSEPQIAGMSAHVEVRESVRNELIKQFPTLESLFGSMDFCRCRAGCMGQFPGAVEKKNTAIRTILTKTGTGSH
jgi:hypothetical protein